jgi:hypothetical protein
VIRRPAHIVGGAGLEAFHPVSIAAFDFLGVFAGWAKPGEGGAWTLPSKQSLYLEVRSAEGRRAGLVVPARP